MADPVCRIGQSRANGCLATRSVISSAEVRVRCSAKLSQSERSADNTWRLTGRTIKQIRSGCSGTSDVCSSNSGDIASMCVSIVVVHLRDVAWPKYAGGGGGGGGSASCASTRWQFQC